MQHEDASKIVPEKATPLITGTLCDAEGVAIPSENVASLTVSIFRQADPTAFINSRNAQSILNVNGGTLHATSGAFAFQTTIGDTTLTTSTADSDDHMVLIRFNYNTSLWGTWLGRLHIVNTPAL